MIDVKLNGINTILKGIENTTKPNIPETIEQKGFVFNPCVSIETSIN